MFDYELMIQTEAERVADAFLDGGDTKINVTEIVFVFEDIDSFEAYKEIAKRAMNILEANGYDTTADNGYEDYEDD